MMQMTLNTDFYCNDHEQTSKISCLTLINSQN